MLGRMKLKSPRIRSDRLGIRGDLQIARPYARKHSVQIAADTPLCAEACCTSSAAPPLTHPYARKHCCPAQASQIDLGRVSAGPGPAAQHRLAK